jgi:Sulfotransferase family
MAEVTIERVEQHSVQSGDGLYGGRLDGPVEGADPGGQSFDVYGWALGRDARVEALEVRDGFRVLAEASPGEARPDIARAYPEVEGAERCGFRVPLRSVDLQPRFSVDVVAKLEGGGSASVATVHGSRRPVSPSRVPAINPLMLTTIGRSGSKWLAWLLSCHPSVLAFQPLVFEPRLTTYWTTAFRAMSAPKSYLRQIHAERWDEPRWWLGDGAGPMPAPLELEMDEWLAETGVDNLAALCQQQVEAFYLEVGRRSDKTDALYFAEKFLLDPILLDLTTEIFPGARELILVRDFRDRLSSVFAWNEKRGEAGFGHEVEMSKAEYLANRVNADAEALAARWRQRGGEAHLVRYEDLILEPRQTLSGILGFLGVADDPDTVAETLEVANRPNELLDGHRTVSDPAQTIGRWRRDLPADLAAECNELLAPVLETFGYER